jgi:hypothetical protein
MVGGVQFALSAMPIAAPAWVSSVYASATTVPRGLAQTLAIAVPSHAAPVQNCAAEQALPHLPQLLGSVAVSTQKPPQHASEPEPEHEVAVWQA